MKKVMVTLISLATLGLGTIVPLQANAQPINRPYQNQCVVQDRRPRQRTWRTVGTYRERRVCERVARTLRREGYQVRILNRR